MSGRFWLISILTFLVVILLGVKVVLPYFARMKSVGPTTKLKVGNTMMMVEIADESHEMEKGLGGRDSLAEKSGMLFVYPYQVTPRFWMKGMRFDLDFIWIRDGKITEITRNVRAPENDTSTLPFYSPQEPIDAMLEVNAGFAQSNKIEVGDAVTFL